MKYHIPKGWRRVRIGEMVFEPCLFWWSDNMLAQGKTDGEWSKQLWPNYRIAKYHCIHIVKK